MGTFFSADRLATRVPCGHVKTLHAADTECSSKHAHGRRSPRRGRESATGSAAPLRGRKEQNWSHHHPAASAPWSKASALRRLRQHSAGSKAPPCGQRPLSQCSANFHWGDVKAPMTEPSAGSTARARSKSAAGALAMMRRSFLKVFSHFRPPNANLVI